MTEELNNHLDFVDPAKLHAVDILRQLPAITDIRLFLRLIFVLFLKILDLLKKKMRLELLTSSFSEYVVKSGNYM